MLRHFLASLAYHITKIINIVPENYPDFKVGNEVRTPREILNHINGVLVYAYKCFNPTDSEEISTERDSTTTWEMNVEFFYKISSKLDDIISRLAPVKFSEERILQGPFSDVMTHIGQLSMLRRLAGSPVSGENFIIANIKIGVVGRNQPAPVETI